MKIGFIGLGKLGMECAEVFAEHYSVQGYDTLARTSRSIHVTNLSTVIQSSDWIFVAVPTAHESQYDGSVPSSHLKPKDFDYSIVKQTLEAINSLATSAKKIVLISTVLPGTVRTQLRPLLAAQHDLIYNPYLIAMGSVTWDMKNPEMVIMGVEQSQSSNLALQLMEIYRPLLDNNPRFEIGTWEEAESIKIFYNTFISVKLSLVNMIQDFAIKIGNIDVDVVTKALARSTQRIMGPKYMTAGMGDAGACHPRDNIALRWLAQTYDIGYDIFSTVMHAREIQARNLARFLVNTACAQAPALPIIIHGKAYKPDVPYCIGSYSVLVAHYLREDHGIQVCYIDPLADDITDVVTSIESPSVVLLAHNRAVTYGSAMRDLHEVFYCDIPKGSILVDPWRACRDTEDYTVVAYGNSRDQSLVP